MPGHTLDHLAYFLPSAQNGQAPVLFCGDALFAAGCGKLFEGSPEQALGSLKRLAALPDETLIYCGHEYTLANLRFARLAEPDNPALKQRQQREQRALERLGTTLPAILGEEHNTNPFLRCREPSLKARVEAQSNRTLESEVSVFEALRRWKDVS